MSDQFYYLLYTTLLANCPVDTRNMLNHIELHDHGDHYEIVITAPRTSSSGFYDYARDVNYNQQRGPKEQRNYQWVERTIRQVSETIGGTVNYELS
jgi:hypothetical protein